MKKREYVCNDTTCIDHDAVNREGLAQQEILPQCELFARLEPAVEVKVEPGDVVGVDDQVVHRQRQLKATTASTTEASPDADSGELAEEPATELLQGELAQGGEEDPQAPEQDHWENHVGDQVDKGERHRGSETWREREAGVVPGEFFLDPALTVQR